MQTSHTKCQDMPDFDKEKLLVIVDDTSKIKNGLEIVASSPHENKYEQSNLKLNKQKEETENKD